MSLPATFDFCITSKFTQRMYDFPVFFYKYLADKFSDWQNQLPMYSIYNTQWHLESSIPTIELKKFLEKLSFICLVENVRVNLPDLPQTRSLFNLPPIHWHSGVSTAQLFCEQLWPTIFNFVDSIQGLVCLIKFIIFCNPHLNLENRVLTSLSITLSVIGILTKSSRKNWNYNLYVIHHCNFFFA